MFVINQLKQVKTIKSPLLGFKKIDDSHPEILLTQLREVLNQHQEVLINRLLRDLPTYLNYRFNVKAKNSELDEIKLKLVYLKNMNVNLEAFESIVQQVNAKPTTHLTNEPFYSQIDALIRLYIKEPAAIH
jgi:hypothetical protein